MKKLLLAFLMLITCFGMTSCNAFFAEEETIVITSISKQLGKNEKGEEGFFIVIEYGNEGRTPDKFFVPDGKKGETGLTGNGIDKIETSVDEKTKETTVTISFTDKEMAPISYKVPLGVSLRGVITEPQEDGSSKIQFEFSDGSKSEQITLPKGEKGDGFEDYRVIDNEDGSKELIIKFTNNDPISIVIPKGDTGTGVYKMHAYTNADKYVIIVEYTTGEKQKLEFDKPNTWISEDRSPTERDGRDGDFFFDTRNNIIYKRENGVWLNIITLQSDNAKTCNVIFDVNDSLEEPAILNGDQALQVKEGTYFGMEGMKDLPEPTRAGYKFDGWYLKKNPTTVNGRFTDTTPVFGNLTLYANWIKLPETQA